VTLGYLGPVGTHTQRAAESYADRRGKRTPSHEALTLVPGNSIPALFQALDTTLDSILVPLENSHEGVVQASMDLLVSSACYIQEEIILQIRQDLMAKPGTRMVDITDIVSHPQAIAQCGDFLQKTFPNIQIHVAESTAAAAKRVADEAGQHIAVIGSPALTTHYALTPLATDIQDSLHNQTRFVVLSRDVAPPTGQDKTSIVFSIKKDQPGGLYQVLAAFASRNINLTHIASRPSKTMLGEYRFFVDCEGHIHDQPVRDALAQIQTQCSLFKLLGSYRKDTGL
jgi:prephenate dehydratase